MHLIATPQQNAMILAASGRIDHASADEFLLALQQQLTSTDAKQVPLIIDFAGVDYISSIGLRSLMVAARQAKAQQRKIGISTLQPLVREVFGIARFELVIPCFDTCLLYTSRCV